jgi:hypothetical protein
VCDDEQFLCLGNGLMREFPGSNLPAKGPAGIALSVIDFLSPQVHAEQIYNLPSFTRCISIVILGYIKALLQNKEASSPCNQSLQSKGLQKALRPTFWHSIVVSKLTMNTLAVVCLALCGEIATISSVLYTTACMPCLSLLASILNARPDAETHNVGGLFQRSSCH